MVILFSLGIIAVMRPSCAVMKLRPKRLNPARCLNHNLCDVGAVHFQSLCDFNDNAQKTKISISIIYRKLECIFEPQRAEHGTLIGCRDHYSLMAVSTNYVQVNLNYKLSDVLNVPCNSCQDKLSYKMIHDTGKPGEVIIDYSKKENATCIVMGSRGLGKIRRTLIGSVSDYVVRHSLIPVVVIPPFSSQQFPFRIQNSDIWS